MGKMGKAVSDLAHAKHDIIAIDKNQSEDFFLANEKVGDVLIDFSTPELTDKLCDYAMETNTPLVIGTTGQNHTQLQKIYGIANSVPIFLCGNMSMGIALFAKHLQELMRFFIDAEVDIIETHHTQKKDVPSGTALLLANAIRSVNHGKIIIGNPTRKREARDIHILSRRMGEVVGEHTVIINTENETFTLSHNAKNRKIFAEGALRACEFILMKEKGIFSIKDLIGETSNEN